MTGRYVLSERAERDLRTLHADSLKRWGEPQTEAYLVAIRDRLRQLAASPFLGRARDEVRQGLRSFTAGEHIIFYRIANDGIEVAGIPHQAQALPRHFT